MIISILLILQIVVSMILLYTSVQGKNEMTYKINKITDIMKYETLYRLTNEGDFSFLDHRMEQEDGFDRMVSLWNYLNNSKDFAFVCFGRENLNINEERLEDKQILNPGRPYILENNNEEYINVKSLSINSNYIDYYDLPTEVGSGFNKNDFNVDENKAVPIIVGNSYKSIYNVGDEINYLSAKDNNVRKLKVIGILEEGVYTFTNNFTSGELLDLEDYILFPQQPINYLKSDNKEIDEGVKTYYKALIENSIMHAVIISDKSKEEITTEIQNISNKNGMYQFDVKTSNDFMEYYKEMYEKQLDVINILFSIVIVFTATSLIVVMLNTIEKRTKELGVRILVGATKLDIAKKIFTEISMIIVFSFVIAISIIYNSGAFKRDLLAIKYLSIVTIILILIISIIPTIKVININIQNLLRRDD